VFDRVGILKPVAVSEWILAFIFTFYLFSYLIDLLPLVHTNHDLGSEIAMVTDVS
jgi:hypothetical protein